MRLKIEERGKTLRPLWRVEDPHAYGASSTGIVANGEKLVIADG